MVPLGRGSAVFIAGLLRAGRRSGELSGWILGPVVAAASVWGLGAAHSALSGGVWFARLGGGVSALWP